MKGSSALCGIHPLQVPLSPALDRASSAGRAPSRTVLGRADALARAHIDAMNRKLRPIYDALDARNYKLSLKLCTAALQKTDAGLIKALKAVTLERLGRPEDALALCREVKDNLRPPADDHLLNTLMMVFKATGCTDEGTSCLERAYEQEADNEELAHFLFGNYLRAQEHQKAQQLSMRMHKLNYISV